MSLNRWQGIGRLTNVPELRYTAKGTAIAGFTVAVDSDRKKQNGERNTSFIRCAAFSKTAEFANKYLDKGTLVYVEGELSTRSYKGADGATRYITEVAVGKIQPLEWKKKEEPEEEFDPNDDWEPPF